MSNHLTGKFIKKGGKLDFSSLASSKQFELFVSNIPENTIESTSETETNTIETSTIIIDMDDEVIEKIERGGRVNETYHNEGNERFNEFIKLFRTIGSEYVMNPYEKLLTTL